MVKFISKLECQALEEELKDHWDGDGVYSISQSHALHSVKPDGPGALLVAPTSREVHKRVKIRDEDHQPSSPTKATTVSYTNGEWVLICYRKKKYPGEVVSTSEEEVQVNVMERQEQCGAGPSVKLLLSVIGYCKVN